MSEQNELPAMTGAGVAPKRIPALDKMISEYLNIRDQRIELTPQEVDLKGKVMTLMHANEDEIGKDDKGIIRYPVEGRGTLILKPTKEKLSLQKPKKAGGEDEELTTGEEQ